MLAMMVSSASTNFVSGVSAAVFAPFLMVLGFMIWDDEWTKKNGSAFSLNMFKCNLTAVWFLAVIIVMSVNTECHQSPSSTPCSDSILRDRIQNISANINPFRNEDVKFLFASSTVGILIGDWTWIEGLKYLGARKVIVMDTLKPFLAALAGWAFFDETFDHPMSLSIGLVLTVVGVTLVGFEVEYERGHDDKHEHSTHNIKRNIRNDRGTKKVQTSYYGIFMAIANAVLHTLGAALTKKFGVDMTTWEINFIRFGFSGLCMLCLALLFQIRDKLLRVSSESTQEPSKLGLPIAKGQYGSIPTTANIASATLSSYHEEARWYELPNFARTSWMRVTLGVVFVSFMHP